VAGGWWWPGARRDPLARGDGLACTFLNLLARSDTIARSQVGAAPSPVATPVAWPGLEPAGPPSQAQAPQAGALLRRVGRGRSDVAGLAKVLGVPGEAR
jgi:hypothetical protein